MDVEIKIKSINQGKEKVEIQYYTSGQKKRAITFKNEKQDGLSTNWYENGQKKLEGNFKNGEHEGLITAVCLTTIVFMFI